MPEQNSEKTVTILRLLVDGCQSVQEIADSVVGEIDARRGTCQPRHADFQNAADRMKLDASKGERSVFSAAPWNCLWHTLSRRVVAW